LFCPFIHHWENRIAAYHPTQGIPEGLPALVECLLNYFAKQLLTAPQLLHLVAAHMYHGRFYLWRRDECPRPDFENQAYIVKSLHQYAQYSVGPAARWSRNALCYFELNHAYHLAHNFMRFKDVKKNLTADVVRKVANHAHVIGTETIQRMDEKAEFKPAQNNPDGMMVLPGKYTVEMAMDHDGKVRKLAGPVSFEAKVLNNTTLPAPNRTALVEFHQKTAQMRKKVDATQRFWSDLNRRIENVRQVLHYTYKADDKLAAEARALAMQLKDIDFTLNGTPAKASFEEVPPEPVSIDYRLDVLLSGTWSSTSAPTKTMLTNYEILNEELPKVIEQLNKVNTGLKMIEDELDKLGAPLTPGRIPGM